MTFSSSDTMQPARTSRAYHITRPRPLLSCLLCRQRKVRCNREHPSCAYCLKINHPCQYDNNANLRDRQSANDADKTKIRPPADTGSKEVNAASEYAWSSNNWRSEEGNTLNTHTEAVDKTTENADNVTQQTPVVTAEIAPPVSQENGCIAPRHNSNASVMASPNTTPTNSEWQSRPSQSQGTTWNINQETPSNSSRMGPPTPVSVSQSVQVEKPRKRLRTPVDFISQSPQADSENNSMSRSLPLEPNENKFQSSGHLNRQGGEQARYVGGGFWAFVKGHELLCDSILTTSEVRASPGTNPQPYIDSQALAGLLKTLPPKPVCDILLYSFLISVRPILPLIHVPTFRNDYNDYWKWYATTSTGNFTLPSPKLLEDPTYLSLLFSVIYCGAATACTSIWKSSTLQDVNKEQTIAQLKSSLLTCQIACQYLRYPTLNTLVADLLANECSTTSRDAHEDQDFLSVVIRIARGMGCHRDGTVLGLDSVSSEIRRRTWWHILWLDVRISVQTGSSTLCTSDRQHQDVQMVSRIRDEDLIKPQKTELLSRPSTPAPSSIIMLFAIGQYETARFEHSLVDYLNGTQGLHQAQFDKFVNSMRALHLQIDDLIDKIPAQGIPEKGLIPSRFANAQPLSNEKLYSDNSSEPTVFMAWARILLTMMKAGTVLLLQKPLLESPNLNKKGLASIWESIIRVSVTYLKHYLQIIAVPSFEPYSWCLVKRRTALQCVFLILIYVHNHPDSPQNHLARYFADEMIDLYAPDEALADESKERKDPVRTNAQTMASWRKLRATRAKLELPNHVEPPVRITCQATVENCSGLLQKIASPMFPIPPAASTDGSSEGTSSIIASTYLTDHSQIPSRDEFEDPCDIDNVLDISKLVEWSSSLTEDPEASYTQGTAQEPMYAFTNMGGPGLHYGEADFTNNFEHFGEWPELGDDLGMAGIMFDAHSPMIKEDEGRITTLLNTIMEGW